jgi:hypothetical protein
MDESPKISASILYLLREHGPCTAEEMAKMINSEPKLKKPFGVNPDQVYAAMSSLRSKRACDRNMIRPVTGYVGRGQKYELTSAGMNKADRLWPFGPAVKGDPWKFVRMEPAGVPEDGKPETVNHPQHYGGDTTYEVVKVMEAWLTPEEFIGAMKFNSFKYGARHRQKGGIEDLKKKKWYDDRLASYLEQHPEVKV